MKTITFLDATEYLSKYDDGELLSLIGKLSILCETANAGPLSNGVRTMELIKLELLRRNNIRKMKTKIEEVVEETAVATIDNEGH